VTDEPQPAKRTRVSHPDTSDIDGARAAMPPRRPATAFLPENAGAEVMASLPWARSSPLSRRLRESYTETLVAGLVTMLLLSSGPERDEKLAPLR
jgi:hypothetical protein